MEKAHNSMRNSQFGTFVKDEIMRDKIRKELRDMDPNIDLAEAVQEVEARLKEMKKYIFD